MTVFIGFLAIFGTFSQNHDTYDIVANSFEQGTIRIALEFFDVRKSEFHSSTSSKSSKSI